MLEEISGFFPVIVNGKRSGFECNQVRPVDIIGTYVSIDFGPNWKHAIVFTWGGDFNELRAAWIAAAAYARATNGVVFDEQEGKLLEPEDAIQEARELEHAAPEAEAVAGKPI